LFDKEDTHVGFCQEILAMTNVEKRFFFQVKIKMFILPPAEKMHNVGFQGNKKRENLTNKLWMISTPEGFRYHYPH